MNKATDAQIFMFFEDAEPVKIGNIIMKPNLHAQTKAMLKAYANKYTAVVNLDPTDVRHFHELCTAPAVAKRIAERLQDMQARWHAKIKYMPRADRRAYRRAFIQELKKFKAFCAANGITYTIQ